MAEEPSAPAGADRHLLMQSLNRPLIQMSEAMGCGKVHCDLSASFPNAISIGSGHYELVPSFLPVSSLNNHVLAIFQSRLAVSGEIPRTSAVSSTLNPPK